MSKITLGVAMICLLPGTMIATQKAHKEETPATAAVADLLKRAADRNETAALRADAVRALGGLGEPTPDGWLHLEGSYFRELDARGPLAFEWRGRPYHVELPEGDADVTFVTIEEGVDDPPAELCLVLLRQRRLLSRVRAALKGGWTVAESFAAAERVA